MAYISRAITPTLQKIHEIFPVITLTGPRQSGKTTLCRHLYPEMPYINFENIQTDTIFRENPVAFLDNFVDGAIIDEVQLQPMVFRALQTVVDEDIHLGRRRKFILTGSSNFSVMAKTSESMAGRAAPLTLLPLSTAEISASAPDADTSTDTLMFAGGYPRVWTSSLADKEIIMQSYIDTYVERDMRQLLNIKDLSKFVKFLGLCAGRTGTQLNRSSLAVDADVSVSTVDAWLSVLEASYIIRLLQPWSTNLNKRLTKAPKIYFCDTGLLCSLLNITDLAQLQFFPLRGQIFENMVINDFLKSFLNEGKKPRMSYFRDKVGHEIDLFIETPDGLHAFEIKASTGFNPDYFKNIRYFQKAFPTPLISATVVYDGPTAAADSPLSRICNFRDVPRVMN